MVNLETERPKFERFLLETRGIARSEIRRVDGAYQRIGITLMWEAWLASAQLPRPVIQ